MVSSRAVSVARYLAELPPGRREVVSAIRDVINRHLPPGYVETMNWGMICWEIPLSRFPDTYNGHPLAHLALAAQKHNFALYSMTAYASPVIKSRLREEFRKAGVRLDMGKSCIRFRSLEGLPLPAVELLASSATVDQYLEHYARVRHGRTKAAARPAPRRTARVEAARERPGKLGRRKPSPARRVAKPARKPEKAVTRAVAKSAAGGPAKKSTRK
jgi:hypothetical protein